MRDLDWSTTTLGPPRDWTPSLVSGLRILLASRAQIFLLWGPDLLTFYNDAARPIFGARHPGGPGLPFREAWAGLWDVGLGTLLENVLSTGEACARSDIAFSMERSGAPEETYFDISCDPMHDDDSGDVGGVFCIVTETTSRVVDARRLSTLRALSASSAADPQTDHEACAVAARILGANHHDLPFALIYLIDVDAKSARLAGSTGVPNGSAAALHTVDLTAPVGASTGWPLRAVLETQSTQVVTDLTQRFGALSGGAWPESTHTAMAVPIATAGSERTVGFLVVGVSPRRALNDGSRGFVARVASQIAATVAAARSVENERKRDEELSRLEQATTHRHRRLREAAQSALDQTAAILGSMTDGFIAMDREGRWTAINAAAERIISQTRAAFIGKTRLELLPNVLGSDLELQLRRALVDRAVVEFESHDQARGGWLSNRICPTPDGGVAVFIRDITDRKRAELELAFLASISQSLAHFTSQDDIMRTVGADIGAYLGLSHCAFAEIDAAADHAVITHDWHRPDVTGLVGAHRISDLVTDAFLTATRAGGDFIVRDTRTDPRTDPERCAAMQIGSFLSVPLIRHGEWRFLLCACHSTPHDWRDDEIALMRELTERLWTRLERVRAEAEVRASEQRYRSLFNTMDEGFYIAEVLFDTAGRPVDHRILEANPAFERHSGVADPVGKTAGELVPGMEPYWNDMFGRVALTGESARFENGSDAVQRWFDVFVSRVGDESSRKVAIVFNDITERRQAAQALRHRTAQFETLLNEAPLGVYLIDADFRVRSVNPAALPTFTGIANLMGRDFDEVMHILWPTARADEFVELFRHTLATGEPFIAPDDTEVREDIGRAEHYAWQIHRIAMPEGGYGVVCYFREISEQVLARKALAQSEARWRGIFERLHEGFVLGEVVHDASGKAVDWRCVEMNAAWEQITGLSREAAQGRTLREVIPNVEPEWVDDFLTVVQTGTPANFTRRIAALDRRYEVHAYRPEPGRFAAVFLDVTDRQFTQLRMHESEQRLRFVMDSMPQKIFTVRPDGGIDYLNPQWAEFTGLTSDQVRDWGRAGFIHPDDLAETSRAWQHGFAHGEALQIENRFQHADGQYRWHINRLRPLRDKTGQILMWVGSSTDIHEQKQAAGELRKLADALVEADRRKSDFLAILAHELRNPLAPIRNALQVLRLGQSNVDTVKSMAGIMERQVFQMVRLVDDLLDVSRISQDKIELRRIQVDLAVVIRQAIETCLPALQSGQHELTQTLLLHPVFLNADPVRLTQVFSNLLNNAVKYDDPGGPISLTVVRQGSDVLVSVKDAGIGIPHDMLTRIFEMFIQVDQSLERTRGGLGIGLTLVQRLVEMHGGTVRAFSAGPGRGSEFVVRLPLPTEAPASAPALDSGQTTSMPTNARRILVVDDNRDSAETLAELLELLGNETRAAFDGEEAMEAAEAFRPDVVMLDIGMPKLNGYEVARKMRGQPWGRAMMLVALTGWGQEDDRRRSSAAGFNHHLVKPVDFDALTQILSAVPAAERTV